MEGRQQSENKDTQWRTATEAAQDLGVSPQRVSQLRKEGLLLGVKRGYSFFYSQEAIRAYKRQIAKR